MRLTSSSSLHDSGMHIYLLTHLPYREEFKIVVFIRDTCIKHNLRKEFSSPCIVFLLFFNPQTNYT